MKKVMVAMSGGVDSSVAAALLLEKGYSVIGVTMQIWPDIDEERQIRGDGCCSLQAAEDARRVADILGIPYYVMNLKDIFARKVIEYFVDEYMKGCTPNPCIACNRHVKFEMLMKKALSMGMDYIATGHYARILYDDERKRYVLKKSAAKNKDQTYVLYNMTQEQLSRTLMPIGEYTKDEVRKMAKKLGLPVAEKRESQDICFVQDKDYIGFICGYKGYEPKPGDFVDTKGNILGKHKGIIHYTVGQRKGLGITVGKPLYVVDIDAQNNRVVLGYENEVFSGSLVAKDLNFISIERLEKEMRVSAKVRYSAKEADATITPLDNGKVKVTFDIPQRAITPGQSVVFYEGDIVAGGGTIDRKL